MLLKGILDGCPIQGVPPSLKNPFGSKHFEPLQSFPNWLMLGMVSRNSINLLSCPLSCNNRIQDLQEFLDDAFYMVIQGLALKSETQWDENGKVVQCLKIIKNVSPTFLDRTRTHNVWPQICHINSLTRPNFDPFINQ